MKEKKRRSNRHVSKRKCDPYLDRRSGEDRRVCYSIGYFLKDKPERRNVQERRGHRERRRDCIRVNEWASVCPY